MILYYGNPMETNIVIGESQWKVYEWFWRNHAKFFCPLNSLSQNKSSEFWWSPLYWLFFMDGLYLTSWPRPLSLGLPHEGCSCVSFWKCYGLYLDLAFTSSQLWQKETLGCLVFLTALVEKTILSPLNPSHSCQTSRGHVCAGAFLDSALLHGPLRLFTNTTVLITTVS